MTPSEFINYIYASIPPECEDTCVSLWDKITKESVHIPLKDIAQPSMPELDQEISQDVAKSKDIYFGVSLRRPNLTQAQRGKIADIRGLPGLFLDIDLDTGLGAHVAQNLPKNLDQVIEIISPYPDPSCIVDSGHGLHVYWLFDKVHPVNTSPTDTIGHVIDYEHALEYFQKKIIARANALGYHVDYTGDITRVLRLPGTSNFKAGLVKPVQVLDSNGPRYASINDLLQKCGIDSRQPIPHSSIKPSPHAEQVTQDLLLPDTDKAKAQDKESNLDAFAKLTNPESRALMELCLQGKPFAPAGSRDQVLQRIASIIAYVAPDRDPKELAQEILYDSLKHFEPEDKGRYTQEDRVDWAAEKIARAQEDKRRSRVVQARQNAALADALLKDARKMAARRDQTLGPTPQGPYDDNEMEAFAKQQNTTVQDFHHRWIIQKGTQFYIYVNGDYQKPVDSAEFEPSVYRDLSPAVPNGYVQIDTKNAKGDPRRKTGRELMLQYGSVARSIVARLDLGHSEYDAQTQTFYEATCPIRPLLAQYHPDIDKWLSLLGGTKASQLLDWVATVTKLSKQSSALYLQGPPGTGKSLFSQGLARLWHQGPPTELIRVLGEWTSDLGKCPLVCADEQIPQSFRGQRTSAELRSLIGNSGRTLTRKYAHNADLVGSIRLILSANNADMLVFDETLSQDDLEAVSGRFLHVIGDKQASRFLQTVNTQGWVDNDLIAKHALWLRDNRTVKEGRRFIVEGSARDVSKQLATRGSVAGRVAEWLVRYLCEPPTSSFAAQQSSPESKDLVRVGNGQYLVNTNAIISYWEQWAKSKVTPNTPQVGSALRNLSTRQYRAGKKRYFVIDIEAISAWSESNLIGDPATIQDRINQELILKEGQESLEEVES